MAYEEIEKDRQPDDMEGERMSDMKVTAHEIHWPKKGKVFKETLTVFACTVFVSVIIMASDEVGKLLVNTVMSFF